MNSYVFRHFRICLKIIVVNDMMVSLFYHMRRINRFFFLLPLNLRFAALICSPCTLQLKENFSKSILLQVFHEFRDGVLGLG